MQIKELAFLGFAALSLAQNDCDGSSDCSSTSVDGIVLTSRETTTDVGQSTTLVPVVTASVATTTDVGVETNRQTLSETTDVGTTPTNTVVQFATTTDVNLQSGYAYTTDSSGNTIATYTGTDTSQPSTTAVVAAGSSETSSAGAGAMITSGPYLGGAAAMGVLAYLI